MYNQATSAPPMPASIKAHMAPIMLPTGDAEYPIYRDPITSTHLAPQLEYVAAIPSRKIANAHIIPKLKANAFTLSFSAINHQT